MTTVNKVILIDGDDNLKTPLIVGTFDNVIAKDGEDSAMILLKLALDGSIKTMIDKHNVVRSELINTKTLERTGKKVALQPVTIEDLEIQIK